jgi:hypothetical protein
LAKTLSPLLLATSETSGVFGSAGVETVDQE